MKEIKRIDHYRKTTYNSTNHTPTRAANLGKSVMNPGWLESHVNNPEAIANIKDMAAILEEVYPDQWDIQYTQTEMQYQLSCFNSSGYGNQEYTEMLSINTYGFDIIVRFPELIIRNSRGKRRNLYNIMTKITYNPHDEVYNSLYKAFTLPPYPNATTEDQIMARGQWIIDHPEVAATGYIENPRPYKFQTRMEGLRHTMLPDEWYKGYAHSHLPSGSSARDMVWQKFCTGEGEINQIFAMLSSNYNPDLFRMLLFQMKGYLEYESLEGGPHVRMASIISGRALDKMPFLDRSTINNFIASVINKRRTERLPLNWDISENGKATIIEDESFEAFLRVRDTPGEYANNTILWIDSDNVFYNFQTISNSEIPASNRLSTNKIVFRGEEVPFTIRADSNAEISDDFQIHPAIKTEVKLRLENYANYEKIRADIARKASEIAHSTRSSG